MTISPTLSWVMSGCLINTPSSDKSSVVARSSPNDGWQILIRQFMLVRILWRICEDIDKYPSKTVAPTVNCFNEQDQYCLSLLILVPALLTFWTFFKALHSPHVLIWPTLHVTGQDTAHGADGCVSVRAVHLIRCGFEDHFKTAAVG